jgi:phosphoesterase RecJ-like protein
MREYPEVAHIRTLLAEKSDIVVIQADNPDADSLGSSLALEHMLGDLGKRVSLYCGVDMPSYLHYLEGWDRVSKDLPKQFDASIIVDASTYTLFEKLQTNGQMGWIASKPTIVFDHHSTVDKRLDFATVGIYDDAASSTGELLYHLAQQQSWPLSAAAGALLMTGILSDTQGLSNELARPETYRVMAALIEGGTSRSRLEEQRREFSKMPPSIFKYKAKLIERTELVGDGRIAHVSVPQAEINEYSPLYNPVALIQNDMLQTTGVALAVVFKHYDDGKVTAAIRTNLGFTIAAKLAEHFRGGGHPYASGFKIVNGRPFNEIKSECIEFATQLLNNLEQEPTDETLQHAHQKS